MTATTNKAISLPVQSSTTTWGDALNNGPFADLDTCLGGSVSKTLTNANVTLSAAESKAAILQLGGTLSGNVQITTVTNGFCLIRNATTGAYLVTFTNGVGAVALIPQGMSTMVHIDATNGVFLAGARTSTVGMIGNFAGITVPGGWVKANGVLLLRASFAALWTYAQASGNLQTDANWTANSMWGTFSSGDGLTTFRIPDLRGSFTRNWVDDNSPNSDYPRICGQGQNAQNLQHTHIATSIVNDPGHDHGYLASTHSGNGLYNYGNSSTGFVNTYWNYTGITVSTSNANSGGTDLRPYNTAMMCCISYL
jgi:microcystin-dependent protein